MQCHEDGPQSLCRPRFCPAAVASEFAGEAMSNFIEGQKLLLGLVQREHEIVTTGVRERVAGNGAAVAVTELVQRGFDTFVEMQQDFLKMATTDEHLAQRSQDWQGLRS